MEPRFQAGAYRPDLVGERYVERLIGQCTDHGDLLKPLGERADEPNGIALGLIIRLSAALETLPGLAVISGILNDRQPHGRRYRDVPSSRNVSTRCGDS